MKKKIICLCIAAVLLVGCGNGNRIVEEATAGETSVAQQETAAASEQTPEAEPTTETENTKAAKDYYGDYVITSCQATAVAYAMSEEEIDGMIGMDFHYREEYFEYNNGARIELPADGYEELRYTLAQVESDFGITAGALGIEKEEVLSVSLLVEGAFPGQYFYVVDEDTILIYHEGVFFRAVRQ